jgi:hypothetical protein
VDAGFGTASSAADLPPPIRINVREAYAPAEQGYRADNIDRSVSRLMTLIVETMNVLILDERTIVVATGH